MGPSEIDRRTDGDYLERLRRDRSARHFFLVCHPPVLKLRVPAEPGIHIWAGPELARAALSAGLFAWLVDRTRWGTISLFRQKATPPCETAVRIPLRGRSDDPL